MLSLILAQFVQGEVTYETTMKDNTVIFTVKGKGKITTVFSQRKIDEVVFSDGITEISSANPPPSALYRIPASVTKIHSEFFSQQTLPVGFIVDEKNAFYKSVDGNIYSKDMKSFYRCGKNIKDNFEIPQGVVRIEEFALFSALGEIKSATIPNSVEYIGPMALCCVFIRSIPPSVKYLGGGNINNGLIDYLSLSEGLEYIGGGNFELASLTKLYIPSTVKYINTEYLDGIEVIISERNPYYKVEGGKIVSIPQKVNDKNVDANGKLVIPSDVSHIRISEYAKCDKIKSVVFSEGVSYIGDMSFAECANLKSITIPDSVVYIGEKSFYKCDQLESVTIPESVRFIGKQAFECLNLKSITIPGYDYNYLIEKCTIFSGKITSVTITSSVSDYNFNSAFIKIETGCSVTLTNNVKNVPGLSFSSNIDKLPITITIPEGVEYIELLNIKGKIKFNSIEIPNSAVYIGSGISDQITIKNDNPRFSISDGIIYNKEKTSIILCATKAKTQFTVPAGIKRIEDAAFANTKLESVIIPEGVEYIGNRAFMSCQLSSIEIPSSVSYVGDEAFNYCDSLQTVTIKDGVKHIGNEVFSRCQASSITIPKSVEYIGNIFQYNTIQITIDSNNPNFKVKDGVVYNKDFTRLIWCNDKTKASFVVPNGVKRIESSAFNGCTVLASITIPEGVEYLGFGLFKGCTSLLSLELPKSIKFIEYGFLCGSKFSKITIPGNLNIVSQAIDEYMLKEVHISSDITGEISGMFVLKVDTVVIEEGVTTICDHAFKNCPNIKTITIPNSVTSVGANPFVGCTGLTTVNLGPKLTSIKLIDGVVYSGDLKTVFICIKRDITSVVFPESITCIDDFAFFHCAQLKDITIPEGLTYIGDHAFDSCSLLETIINKESTPASRNFLAAPELQKIHIPDSVTYIGEKSFFECSSLKGELHIPESIKTINSEAFSGCTKIEGKVTIPPTIESIGLQCFGNSNIQSLTYLGNTVLSNDLGLSPETKVYVSSAYPDKTFGGKNVEVDKDLPEYVPPVKPTDPDTTPSNSESGGLSGGEIAGIVIGSIAAVALVSALVIYFLWFRKRSVNTSENSADSKQEENGSSAYYEGK